MIAAIFGLLGVLVGAFAQWLRDVWSERTSRQRQAHYLAIHAICALDKFIDACADVAHDDGWYGEPFEEDGRETRTETPDAPSLPDDVDWKSIPHTLAYDLLSLSRDVKFTDQRIKSACIDGPDCFFEERQYQYAILGIKASDLVKQLRCDYNIRDHALPDPAESMRKVKGDIEKLWERRNSILPFST